MKQKQSVQDLINKFNLNHTSPVVYCFEHLPTGKKYIGSSIDLKRRMEEHFSHFNNGKHCNKLLLNNWNKYFEQFTVYILEWLSSTNKEYLESREEFWIDFYNSYDKRYGFNFIRDPRIGGLSGYKHTDESKKKMSESIKKFHKTPESQTVKEQSKLNLLKIDKEKNAERARIRGKTLIGEKNPFFGKTHTEATKKIFSDKRRGTKIGANNPNYGKKISESSKTKMKEGFKRHDCVVAVRHVVLLNDELYYVINTKKFIEDKINKKLQRLGMRYFQDRKCIKILFKSSQFICSNFKYKHIPYYKI